MTEADTSAGAKSANDSDGAVPLVEDRDEMLAAIVVEVFTGNLTDASRRGEVDLDDIQTPADAVGFELGLGA